MTIRRKLMAGIIAAVLVAAPAAAEWGGSAGPAGTGSVPGAGELLDWPESLDVLTIHKYLGYATFAGVVTTGLMGLLAPGPVHGNIARVTAAMAVTNTSLGLIGYRSWAAFRDPHAVLNMIGTAGFVANVFFTTPGSLTHQVTGGIAVTSFTVGVSIRIFD